MIHLSDKNARAIAELLGELRDRLFLIENDELDTIEYISYCINMLDPVE